MALLRQFFAILRMNLTGMGQRLGSVLTIIVGVTCAVGVLISMLAMGTGARREQLVGVRDDGVVLTSKGMRPFQSNISRDEANIALHLPGIRKDLHSEPIVVFDTLVPVEGRRRATGKRSYFLLFGVTSNVLAYRADLRFTAGRMFRPGLHELVASNPCARQFTDFEVGSARPIHGSDWTVVGLFDEGAAHQCIVYADLDTIMSTLS